MGTLHIQELSESLVITRPRGNGCAVGFLLVWLTGWTFGLVKIAAESWSASSWNVLVLMGLPEVVVLGVLLYSLAGRERLTIGARDITYEHSAIVTFDRCAIRMEDIQSVDLMPLDPTKRKDRAVGVLVIRGGDSEIRFGVGLSGLELHELLSRIRESVDEQRAERAPTISGGEVAPINHTQQVEQATKSWKAPIEAVLLAPAIVIALVFRFRSLPWDHGGCVFQVCVSVMGLGVLAALPPRLKALPRAVAALILVPDLLFLLLGALRFAPQALFALVLLAGFAAGACYLWSRSKLRLALLLALALIPIAADLYFYGVAHMRAVNRIRNLLPQEIQEVRIEDPGARKAIVIRDRQMVALVAKGLGDTSPYSPNSEHISEPRHLTIRLIDGSTIEFRVGKGNRAHAETVWIQFGVEVYQNESLYPVLQSHDVFAKAQPAGR